jgi:hypothetical protein
MIAGEPPRSPISKNGASPWAPTRQRIAAFASGLVLCPLANAVSAAAQSGTCTLTSDKRNASASLCKLAEQQIGAVVVGASTIVRAKRDQILTLAARYGLPTMFPYVRTGLRILL